MTEHRWLELMERLSMPANSDTYEALVAAYSEEHRHYHSVLHIDRSLAVLDEFRRLAQRPDEVELAIWFHDAVYDPHSSDNEARSANWARRFMLEKKNDRGGADRVYDLIMATTHDSPIKDQDAQLLADIDLAILGTDTDTYQVYESDVRREYSWVPVAQFSEGRRKILESFMDRDQIYSIPKIRERYETQARLNLASAIESLSRNAE